MMSLQCQVEQTSVHAGAQSRKLTREGARKLLRWGKIRQRDGYSNQPILHDGAMVASAKWKTLNGEPAPAKARAMHEAIEALGRKGLVQGIESYAEHDARLLEQAMERRAAMSAEEKAAEDLQFKADDAYESLPAAVRAQVDDALAGPVGSRMRTARLQRLLRDEAQLVLDTIAKLHASAAVVEPEQASAAVAPVVSTPVNAIVADPNVPADRRLLLMPCSDKKMPAVAPASLIYRGVFWTTLRTQRTAQPHMAILSAKHGFVGPDALLDPYNELMTTARAHEWLALVEEQTAVVRNVLPADPLLDVMIVGGITYRMVMVAVVARLRDEGRIAPEASINATHGGIGEQRSQLGAWLRSIPSSAEPTTQDTIAHVTLPSPDSSDPTEGILTEDQKHALRAALAGKPLAACFGSGVDSTAMLVALHEAGLKPDVITFADGGGEKKLTLTHLDKMNAVLRRWGWPLIDVCKKKMLATTGYDDLYGNCVSNETLPSIAFGMKSCSIKYKQVPQDQFLMGAKRGPNARPAHRLWLRTQATGRRIVKLIGYDCGRADMRRSKTTASSDANFDFSYPLQLIGWARGECVAAITAALGADMVPIKSACFFCPASKLWELYWLAAHDPDQLEQALHMERVALTGRHSRFSEVEFGASWEDMVRNADRFPSTNTCVGLGRSFAWNQWARVNGVVDEAFRVKREQKLHFIAMSDSLRGSDNALDARTLSAGPLPFTQHVGTPTEPPVPAARAVGSNEPIWLQAVGA